MLIKSLLIALFRITLGLKPITFKVLLMGLKPNSMWFNLE